MPLITCIVWIMLALFAALVIMWVSARLRFRRFVTLLLAMITAVGSAVALFLFRTYVPPTPLNVTITSPRNGTLISESQVLVTGTVTHQDARVTVVVRSETDLRWWIQSIVPAESDNSLTGHWSVNAYIGTPELGRNENFQIIALASADSSLFNLLTGRMLTSGTSLDSIPLWSQSEPVIIRREQ